LVMLASALVASCANAADAPRSPTAVLGALADRIYVLGETTGSATDMIAAEVAAAEEIRQYVGSGAVDGLLAKARGEQSPLVSAAYLGYPNVVAALLTSSIVKDHINDADEMGLTPWIAANFSMRQSLWTCNPAIFSDPFRFVPMMVTQPYYLANPAPPYQRTRELLERAGAAADITAAKALWIKVCKNQTSETKAIVSAATDFQSTVQELGAADLTGMMAKLHEQAQAVQKKP